MDTLYRLIGVLFTRERQLNRSSKFLYEDAFQGNLYLDSFILVSFVIGLLIVFTRKSNNRGEISPKGIFGILLVGISAWCFFNYHLALSIFWSNLFMTETAHGSFYRILSNKVDENADTKISFLVESYLKEIGRFLPSDKVSRYKITVLAPRGSDDSPFARNFQDSLGYGHWRSVSENEVVVIIPMTAGLGSLTHNMTYHLSGFLCDKKLPNWVTVGLGTLFEKWVLVNQSGDGVFSLGYRSNWRGPVFQKTSRYRALSQALIESGDQYFLQTFFVYLYHRGWLTTLASAACLDRHDFNTLIENSSGKKLEDLNIDWKKWIDHEMGEIPIVPQSSVLYTNEEIKLFSAQNRQMYWDSNSNRLQNK